ncbi:hypothetical protein D934_08880 [Xylella fastidiosa subsp. sandyi Ann-1]|uniref:Uncharacterized protein n=1 Tax=Xylella fastidiosa subsp. sandyi Ann-1 TaxID=155920 RepID=A0A060HEN7_XYLFS|nr:hypothetical protein [Xylella fastidiosa]AIC11387.1 hypothetical protein D934_08880 [Xylella fastidiosa subsp. sandyi Ann-1]
MSLLWKITARNWMDWPTERQHRVTGERQHIEYSRTWTWADGPKPQMDIARLPPPPPLPSRSTHNGTRN